MYKLLSQEYKNDSDQKSNPYSISACSFLCSCRDVDDRSPNQQIATETGENVGPLSDINSNETVTTIRFAVNDFEVSQYDALRKVFEEENPNIRIQLLSANEILDSNSASDDSPPTDIALQLAQTADVFQPTMLLELTLVAPFAI